MNWSRTRPVCAVLILSLTGAGQEAIMGTGDRLVLGPAQLKMDNSTVVPDPATASGEALESGGKRWDIVHYVTAPLPAGRYRVTARLQLLKHGPPTHVGRLLVNAYEQDRLYDATVPFGTETFAGEKEYRDVAIDVVRPPSKDGRFRLFVRVQHEAETVPIRVEYITVEALAVTPVYVHTVWPEKLLATPGSAQPITVSVSNITARPQSGFSVKLELVHGLDEVVTVGEKPLELGPHEGADLAFGWNTGEREYGYEARATVRDAQGAVVSTHSDYFAVSSSHFKLRIHASPRHQGWYLDKTHKVRSVTELRLNYGNYVEVYGWPPSAFAELYPRQRFWTSGQVCAWQYDREVMKAWIEEMHRLGLRVTSYNISIFNGWPGLEWMRKHPEWCAFDEQGRPAGGVNAELWPTREQTYADNECPEKRPFTGEMPNSGRVWPMNDELMQHAADEIIRTHNELGFDGMRWDGHPIVYVTKKEGAIAGTEFGKMVWNHEGKRIIDLVPGGDLDAQSLHNMRLIKDAVRAAAPAFEWGYNAGYDLTAEQQPRTWKECAQNAGIWVEGGFRSGDEGRADPTNTWAKYMDKLWLSSQFAMRSGGYPIHGALGADSTIVRRFMNAIFFTQGSHTCWHGGTWGEFLPYSRFATRYCAYLYDPRLHPWWGIPDIRVSGWVEWEVRNADAIPPLDTAVRIQAPGRLFFPEKMLFQRQLSAAQTETVFHLVNHPVKPYVDYTEMQAPPVQERIVVTLRAPTGMTARDAWCLSPDTWPMEQQLTVAPAQQGWVTVTVPKLVVWDILVVRWGREEG